MNKAFQVHGEKIPDSWRRYFKNYKLSLGASLVAQMVKNPSAVKETWVQSLSREEPPEKQMATHSSILAWRILWTEEPGGLRGRKDSDTAERQQQDDIILHLEWTLNPTTGVLVRERREGLNTERHGRERCEDRGRGWNGELINQKMLATSRQ